MDNEATLSPTTLHTPPMTLLKIFFRLFYISMVTAIGAITKWDDRISFGINAKAFFQAFSEVELIPIFVFRNLEAIPTAKISYKFITPASILTSG